MKKRMAMIVFSLFFLCSCAPNTGQSGSGSQTEPPIASIPETSTGTIEVLAPYSDVRGFDEVNTLRSGEYVPADMITYWFKIRFLRETKRLRPRLWKLEKIPDCMCRNFMTGELQVKT